MLMRIKNHFEKSFSKKSFISNLRAQHSLVEQCSLDIPNFIGEFCCLVLCWCDSDRRVICNPTKVK